MHFVAVHESLSGPFRPLPLRQQFGSDRSNSGHAADLAATQMTHFGSASEIVRRRSAKFPAQLPTTALEVQHRVF
jgi:hypothetical protein